MDGQAAGSRQSDLVGGVGTLLVGQLERTGRVVPRPYAEWCLVVDVLGAVALVVL
ncbi:MAG TPA: hypothetical protein VHF24_01240 [Acidimicrobiales bacterium]|nr:hypothetical protein [Acidimicrobiales bacterium]